MGFPNTRQQTRKSRGIKDQEGTREQKEIRYHQEDCSMSTRSVSPVPSLALQMADHQHPTTASTVKIPKRHTAPYPSPNASPNISPPAPARSYTHPVGKDFEKHQQRYMDRMHSKLEPHLRTLDQAQGMPKELTKQVGTEDEPVPHFFISPGANNYLDDDDMLHEEFVTIGSLDELDYIFGFQTAEYMPDPEEPMQEPVQKPCVTVESPCEDQEAPSHSRSATTQGLLAAPAMQGPVSDSGVGSTLGSPGTLVSNSANVELQGFATTGFSGTGALPGHAGKVSTSSSLGTEAGLGNGCLIGRSSLVPETGSSYSVPPYQEPTPPSSATLSPASFHAIQPDLNKAMDAKSIRAIERHIIIPMSENADFVELKGVLSSANEKMHQGQIRCLRDVEKYLFNMVNKTSTTAPPRKFLGALLDGIQSACREVLEKDRIRETDAPYTNAYFLDARPQLGIESDMHHSDAQQRVPKRKQSIDAEASSSKRVMTITTDSNAQETFFKPSVKPRQNKSSKQHLEIVTHIPTAAYNLCQLVGYPHMGNNSTFQFDEDTKNTIAKSQSYDVRAYYLPTFSQSWRPNNQLVVPTSMINAQGEYSPAFLQTSMDTSSTPPLAGFAVSPAESTSAVSAGSPPHPSPVSRASSKEPPNYSCDFCQKAFPRPCDLTKHRKTHDRPFKCDIEACKYHIEGFPTNKEKERHQNDIHALNSKEWKCEFAPCPYKSKRESNCKQHMEKAHEYVYKRMKRNPRRRDQGVAVTPTRRKKNTSISNESQSSTPAIPNDNFEIPHLSQSTNYLVSFGLLDPNSLHGNNFPWQSPLTNTDYDQSPLSITRDNFEDHHNGHRANPMMPGLTSDWIIYDGAENPVDQYPDIPGFHPPFPFAYDVGNESSWNLDSDTSD